MRTACKRSIYSAVFCSSILPFAASGDGSEAPEPAPVIAKGENFTRNGKPIRFWGCNITGVKKNHDEISMVVQRMQDFRFNAVRLWSSDCGSYKKGDNSGPDRFDFFTASLKEKGIGIYCTGLVKGGVSKQDVDRIAKGDVIDAAESDRQAWLDAIRSAPFKAWKQTYSIGSVKYVDERVTCMLFEKAGAFLDHQNLYTGIRNADENNFILWDLVNEDPFIFYDVSRLFGKDLRTQWPPYFLHKLQDRYNAWLEQKYTSHDKLKKAWHPDLQGLGMIALAEDEALKEMNIRIGIDTEDGKKYIRPRAQDFVAFCTDLVVDWYQRYETHCRRFASRPDNGIAVTPVTYNTNSVPNMPDYYRQFQGDAIATGSYKASRNTGPGGCRWPDHPQDPYDPMLYRGYHCKPLEHMRPADRPVVIYETNDLGFSPFRSEHAWYLAAVGSWQNLSGVFWYHAAFCRGMDKWRSHYYDHFDFIGDEPFSSALAAAGDAFVNGQLPTAQNPSVITYPERTVMDPVWRRYAFEPERYGYGYQHTPHVEGAPLADIRDLYPRMRVTAFTRGLRVRFVDDAPFDIKVDGPLDTIPDNALVWIAEDWGEPYRYLFNTSLNQENGVVYDWANGVLRADCPQIKLLVGWPGTSEHTWADGFAVNGLNASYVALSIQSLDGVPLVYSRSIRISANGMQDDETRKGHGTKPILHRLSGQFRLPKQPGRKAHLRNWHLETIAVVDAETGFSITSDQPVFDIVLQAPRHNGNAHRP